jgi:hypothetical protein
MRDPRDAYERDVANSTSGFGKDSQAYRADGGANDENHGLDQQSNTWYIRLNGKLIKDKSGNPYAFQDKAAANKAARIMQAKLFNKDKEFMLTTNPNDKQQGVAEGHTEVKDKQGKVVSWKDDSEWHPVEKNKQGQPKDPRGVVTHLSDVARRKTADQQGVADDDMDEGFVGNMVNKAKSMFTKPGQSAAAPTPAAPAPVVPDAATQARIAAAPQGYDPNTGKPQVAAKAAPGAVAKGGTLDLTKFPGMKPDQIKQAKQANQAAAAQTAQQRPAATAAQPAATQPAQQQPTTKAPSTLDKPYDPATGKGAKYDGVTGKPTPEWQKELDKQEAAREVEYQANRQKSQAAAAERDAQNAELVRQGVRQNPSNVTNNITQTSTAPGNVKIANGDPAQVKTAMQAKIDAMKAKNPKLAAAMQAEIDALGEGLAEGDVDSDGYSVDHADSGEYDYEGDQARDQMNTIVRAARRLDGLLDDNENMPEWVQMKVTLAADYLDTAADYIESNQEPELEEGWKEKLGGAALAGAMALGAGGAQARVMPGDDPGINRLTGKPIATQQATDTAPTQSTSSINLAKPQAQYDVDTRILTYKGKQYKWNSDAQATGQGEVVTAPSMAVGSRSMGSTKVELNPNGTYTRAPANESQEKVGDMDADKFDAAMARLKQLAGAGPLKTVYDPEKRVYRNVPVAVQPKK